MKKIEEQIISAMRAKPGAGFYAVVIISLILTGIGVYCSVQTIYAGVGCWGINNQHNWGVSIVNFVWWIGIGHAGTFISAVLLLLRQNWRAPVFRLAETITLFSILCAAFFPFIHLGRHALFFYIFPYFNTRGIWVSFSSPLFWDMAAILVYLTVSLVFWYTELIPDLYWLRRNGIVRIRLPLFRWHNTIGQKMLHSRFTFFLASLATPLVISVHSIVSIDFAVSNVPGWNSTIFPPFFVAGAVFSGFAMVQLFAVTARSSIGLADVITVHIIETMNKLLLALSILISLCYLTEIIFAFLPGNEAERVVFVQRLSGSQIYSFYPMILLNSIMPLLFWFKRVRQSMVCTVIISLCVLAGMWLERWIIVNGSLSVGYFRIHSVNYFPSFIEMGIFAGTLGFFILMMTLAFRFLPMVSIYEINKQHAN